MKRKLKIVLYSNENRPVQTLIAGHLDATRNITVISDCINTDTGQISEISIPDTIENWNIFEGLVTIYYKGGHFMEISRFYD